MGLLKETFKPLLAGLVIGAAMMYMVGARLHWFHAADSLVKLNKPRYPIKATLYRFKLNKRNLSVYQEWVKWHDTERGPIVATLEREKMYVESVFRDTVNEPDVIYWLTVNGQGGANYDTSPLAADKKHSAYMKQVLMKGSRIELKTEFLLLPPFIENSMIIHQLENK